MTNDEFICAIERSFMEFIYSGTSRSSRKLGPLHGAIAQDMQTRLGTGYSIHAQGFGDNKERLINGRYIDKKVDITICSDEHPVCGIAVKFVMQNYAQNANNYFENMLGETANIRAMRCPYFQVLVILDKLPYYDRNKTIKHWETFGENHCHKYVVLSSDNPDCFYHTPSKTLLYLVQLPDPDKPVKCAKDYFDFFKDLSQRCNGHGFIKISDRIPENLSAGTLGPSLILNDYEAFAQKVYHATLAL